MQISLRQRLKLKIKRKGRKLSGRRRKSLLK